MALKHKYSVTYNDELYTALTCSICLDFFKNPKQMPNCSHTFCADCLETLVATAAGGLSFDCPNCRTRNFILNGGVRGLPTNIVAQQLVEKVNLESWASENGAPASVTAAVDKDKCVHLFSNNRTNCAHCNGRFCDRCLADHVKNVREKIVERDDACRERFATIDFTSYEERVNAKVDQTRRELDNRMAIIETALKAEHDRIMAETVTLANREIGKTRAFVTEIGNLTKRSIEIRANAQPLVSASELAEFDSELTKREKMVAEAGKTLNSPVPLDLVLETDTSFIGNIVMRWKVGIKPVSGSVSGPSVPSSVRGGAPIVDIIDENSGPSVEAAGLSDEHFQEQLASTRSFYEQMSIVTTGATKDAFGGTIRLPRRICQLNGDRVALIHEVNRISIFQWNGRISSTLKVFDPRKSKSELFLQDFAYDTGGQLFLIGDNGTLVGTVVLSVACNRMPECVVPVIFLRKGAHQFRGIAVSSPKQEVYIGEGSVIAVYSLIEKTKLRSFAVNNVAEPSVVGCNSDTPYRIFFSSNSGDTLSYIDRSDLSVKTLATKGAGLGEVHQLCGICFDQKGNLLVADAKNSRIQVFSSNLTVLSSFGSSEAAETSSQNTPSKTRLKPFGVAAMMSTSNNNTIRIVVPDYAGHRICFFESKKSAI